MRDGAGRENEQRVVMPAIIGLVGKAYIGEEKVWGVGEGKEREVICY